MSKEQREMMDAEDKFISSAGSPLTKLFRQVLAIPELKITSLSWNNMLTRYLRSSYSRVPNNAKDIGQERNNFNRAIAKEHITFRSFLKAIQIICPIRYSMSIRLELRTGKVVEVSTGMLTNPWASLGDLKPAYDKEFNEDVDHSQRVVSDDDLDCTLDDIPDGFDPNDHPFLE